VISRYCPDGSKRTRRDIVLPVNYYVKWWEAEWFKEWERLALHRN